MHLDDPLLCTILDPFKLLSYDFSYYRVSFFSDKMCFLQVKHPQDVLPPALGASMYAIACILSYDGLPAMVPPNDLSANRGSGQDLAEASRFSQGRRAGYIPPSGFLISLLADRTHPGCASTHTRPSRAPVGRFDRSQRPFRNSGPGSSAPRSFKRQRDAARWAGLKGSLLHALLDVLYQQCLIIEKDVL